MAQYAESSRRTAYHHCGEFGEGLRSHKGLDVQSTYKKGEIARQFKKEYTWRQEKPNQTENHS